MEKVAVLADIHGNLAALHALVADLEQWSPDLVVVAGDVVNRGPQSGPCLDLILRLVAERGWQLIRGNHERYVISYDHERHHLNAAHDDVHRLLSAAPLATSTDRHELWHATTPKNRAQVRGRASGVRCKAMLGGP